MEKRLIIFDDDGGRGYVVRFLTETRSEDLMPLTPYLYEAVQFCLGFRGEVQKQTGERLSIEFDMQYRNASAEAGKKAAEEKIRAGKIP